MLYHQTSRLSCFSLKDDELILASSYLQTSWTLLSLALKLCEGSSRVSLTLGLRSPTLKVCLSWSLIVMLGMLVNSLHSDWPALLGQALQHSLTSRITTQLTA